MKVNTSDTCEINQTFTSQSPERVFSKKKKKKQVCFGWILGCYFSSINSVLVYYINRVGCLPGFSKKKTLSCDLQIQARIKDDTRDSQVIKDCRTVKLCLCFRLHLSSGQVDGQNTAHD